MPPTHAPAKVLSNSKKHTRPLAKPASSQHVVDEINAYIAIRDELLAEAEQIMTPAKIDSVTVANDFVATCLKPAHPPYHAQCLPETDAVRERRRCETVKARIQELIALVAAKKTAGQAAVRAR
jgi:hypothetical protein